MAEIVLADEQGGRRAHGGDIQAAVLGDEVPARPPPSHGRAGAGAQGWLPADRHAPLSSTWWLCRWTPTACIQQPGLLR